jgi:hypothetical protein
MFNILLLNNFIKKLMINFCFLKENNHNLYLIGDIYVRSLWISLARRWLKSDQNYRKLTDFHTGH